MPLYSDTVLCPTQHCIYTLIELCIDQDYELLVHQDSMTNKTSITSVILSMMLFNKIDMHTTYSMHDIIIISSNLDQCQGGKRVQ